MKSLWNAVSFAAIANLLALVILAGWLWGTGRLDRERLGELREMLSLTGPQAAAAAEEAARAVAALQEQAADQERRDNPPLSSAERIALASIEQQQSGQVARSIEDTQDHFLAQVEMATRQVDEDRAALEMERKLWEESTGAERQRRSDEQFIQAVKLLESLPPKRAKGTILELAAGGNIDQAVAYLDAMNQRAASKLLAEFKTDQEKKLATELLERLRTFGVGDDAETDSGNAGTTS